MANLEIHAPLALAVGAVFIPLDTGLVGLRMYARKLQGKGFGIDDWACVGSLAFVIAMAVTIIANTDEHRLGYAQGFSSQVSDQPNANIAWWPVVLLQICALGFLKTSFIWFYRRTFNISRKSTESRKFHVATVITLALVWAWTIGFFFAFLFICRGHFNNYWFGTILEKESCIDINKLHNSFATSDFLIDCIIIALPLPMIWGTRMSTGSKVGVTAIFGLGILTVACSCVRMVLMFELTSDNYKVTADIEYINTNGSFWTMIEAGLGVATACLPLQYYFFKGGKFRFFRAATTYGSHEYGYGLGSQRRRSSVRKIYVDSETGLELSGRTDFGNGVVESIAQASSRKSSIAKDQILVTHRVEQIVGPLA